ncbi:hypothetical protein [Paracidovorax valerianellae]|uniref:Lipoprotein n=1 Tax=Paracidovorax valerianellae TaxID=187868 RepID=A0A1G7FHU9_9BURK|nr:hypothetical protein [Paracidovorax valerianellae]MDA8445181.1 hypothetical protein [Paracidovorax valerianellae]SDE75473.1 hypothetical protein SAMN05192589_13011 [Paracidovorax valerianellae]
MLVSKLAAVASLAFAVTGCSSMRNYTMPEEDNLLSGAGSLVVKKATATNTSSAEQYERIDIDELLKTYGLMEPEKVAEAVFDNQEAYKYRRNDMQDHLIAVSNQRCAYYLRVLTASKSQTQVGWGGLAALLSGAAAVTTPAAAAKVLAAGSTVSNAMLSQYNEAYFNNLTVQVISTGIVKQREAALLNMTSSRKASMTEYPVNSPP